MPKKAKKEKSKNKSEEAGASSFQHNMQPPAGILNVFSRLNYKVHYAIAEFVDNSTQSYLLHRDELRKSEDDFKLSVVATYDSKDKTLRVVDNAYGMERDRFLDAITLDAKNSEQTNSRNEFGMGLKTAASWFGNVWSVTSTALGSTNRYTAKVDIPKLQKTGQNEIQVEVTEADPAEHGTTIEIEQVTKGVGPRAVGKTRSLLASMYRRDLSTGEVHIEFNDVPIHFDPYPILKFRDQEWKKPLDFSVHFGDKTYQVTGFVGIMNPGSFSKAGFALFRRNRVIVGGEDCNYKPSEIYGQAQSQTSLKLFGELDVDDFPVNQAKDGFIWDDGLEDEFIHELKQNISEFIQIAKMSKEERAKEDQFSDEASAKVGDEVSRAVDNANRLFDSDTEIPTVDEMRDSKEVLLGDPNLTDEELIDLYKNELDAENAAASNYSSSARTYAIKLDRVATTTISVKWIFAGNEKWIDVKKDDETGDLLVDINVNHSFFKPYSNEDDFQIVLEKFVIAFVVAEERAKLTTDQEGRIYAHTIRDYMNEYLQKLTAN